MEDEHKGISHGLSDLEETTRQIGELAASVQRLALSIESMTKSQAKQEARLETLESRDGKRWRSVVDYALTVVVGIVIGYIATRLGF